MAGLTEKQWMQIFILPTLQHAGKQLPTFCILFPSLLDLGTVKVGSGSGPCLGIRYISYISHISHISRPGSTKISIEAAGVMITWCLTSFLLDAEVEKHWRLWVSPSYGSGGWCRKGWCAQGFGQYIIIFVWMMVGLDPRVEGSKGSKGSKDSKGKEKE